MPNRKQRRRRSKDFRHDVRVYEVDEEGNEIPISELRSQEDRTPKPKPAQKGGRPARAARQARPPSWEKALKTGGMMGAAMAVILYFVNGPLGVPIGLFYGAIFVPMTFWIDRTKYRMELKKAGQPAAAKKR
ncbi:MAG TPA: hypothetical protein VGI77_08385 [Gaiellaceae bacterium]|jgi:hypothetical protein